MIVSFKAGPDIISHLRKQENKSAYIRQLIRQEIELNQFRQLCRQVLERGNIHG